jgi:5'-deoxynucleotidase YfbR-like HD superfamily hydrolase
LRESIQLKRIHRTAVPNKGRRHSLSGLGHLFFPYPALAAGALCRAIQVM